MNFDSYKNALSYPSKADFTVTYWYRDGACICTQYPGEILASDFKTEGCVKQSSVDEAAFRAARDAYGAETARLTAKFKADLFADLGIADHPQREKLYSKAWDDGHANGLSEVHSCAENLVDLLEPFTQSDSLRQYFKDVVAEAKRHSSERGEQNGGVLHSCTIPQSWFAKSGPYHHLTDYSIDNMQLGHLKMQLALFIANCYRQR